MSEDQKDTYKFAPLKADNWSAWKRRIEAIAMQKGLWDHLEGKVPCPGYEDPTKPTRDEEKAIRDWEKHNTELYTLIVVNVSDSEEINLGPSRRGPEVWAQLKTVKESSSGISRLTARRRLYRTYAEDGDDIAAHVLTMRKIEDDLRKMGAAVADEDFLDILMTSLPESWDNFTNTYTTANATGINKITSQEFIAAMHDELRRRTARETKTDTALKAYSPAPKPASGTQSGTTRGKCYNCNKPGHKKDDCWAKGGGKEGQGPGRGRKAKKSDTANKADDESGEWDMAYMAVDSFDAPGEDSRDAWWIDSCASKHVCVNKSLFIDYIPQSDRKIGGIGGERTVMGIGTVGIKFRVGQKILRHHVKNVLHVPNFNCNLLSLGHLDTVGVKFEGEKGKIMLKNTKGQVVGLGHKKRGMYLLDAVGEEADRAVANAVTEHNSWEEWHKRYGHLAYSGLETLKQKNMVEGLDIVEGKRPEGICEACVKAKLARRPFPKESKRKTEKPGELTVTDVWGPSRIESLAKSKYYISFTDHNTRRVTVLFLKKKDEAYDCVTGYLTRVERKYEYLPKAIRFDNGKEYINQRLENWLKEKGIETQPTAPYSPSQNGIAERFNRTLLELARAMLFARGLPKFLWAEAVSHAAYLRNHAPTRALDGMTPEEAWTGQKPDVSHLREFGCPVWVRDEDQNLSKLSPRANEFIFVGFEDGSKAIRYYDAQKRRVKVSRNYVFGNDPDSDDVPVRVVLFEGEREDKGNQQNATEVQENTKKGEETHQDRESTPAAPTPTPNPPSTGIRERPARAAKKSVDYKKSGNPQARLPGARHQTDVESVKERAKTEGESDVGEDEVENPPVTNFLDIAWMASDENIKNDVPRSVQEAKKSPEWPQWLAAMEEEHEQLKSRGTWELVEPMKGRKAIGCRWVFAKKYDERGKLSKYKARLVAQGFSQIPGIDYTDNYAPVARLDAVRTCMALSAIKNWKMRQLDIKGAYLNGVLEEEIYMRQPDGFDDGSGRICKLKRALYGLKQAGRIWNKTLHSTLTTMGYSRTHADPCVYTKIKDDITIVLTVWVDDLIICGNSEVEIDKTVAGLGKAFEVKDMGEPKLLLGIQITRDAKAGTIKLSQQNYIKTILDRFGYSNVNPTSSPLDPNTHLKKREKSLPAADPATINDYQTKLGSIMYAAMGTLPQLAFAVQKLSQFSSNPAPEHLTALKRVFRYLVHVRNHNLGLTYGGQKTWPEDVVGYSDSDWASDLDDRRSTAGFVFMLGGGAISWSSKKQASPATSSCEAEYMAAAHCARHAIWLRRLLSDLSISISSPMTLFLDNQSSIRLTQDEMFSQRSKHIDIQYHFTRHHVLSGNLMTFYCPTNDMLADLMTKALPHRQHEKLTEDMGLLPV
jgi:hypothetical protein